MTLYPSPDLYPAPTLYPGSPGLGAPSNAFVQALRSGSTQWVTVGAFYNGGPAWPRPLTVTGGSVTDDSSPGVRRTLALDVASEAGLSDALAVPGTQLVVTHVLRYPDGTTERTPMGVFDVDVQKVSMGADGRTISLTAPDKWQRVIRARFAVPQSSSPGILVTDQIANLLRGALPQGEFINNLSGSTATVGPLVWDTDRDKAIIDLAAGIGAYVFFGRDGQATIVDLPQVAGRSADWVVDASASGILLSADLERSRQRTYNVVKVTGSSASAAPFDPQVAWDSDPSSVTYAGPDPINLPELAGPFGVATYNFSTPVVTDPNAAMAAARTILYRVTGLASQLTMTAVKNPKMDALDTVAVVLPPEDSASQPMTAMHIVDRVSHPLMVTDAQQITTRSTRSDPYT